MIRWHAPVLLVLLILLPAFSCAASPPISPVSTAEIQILADKDYFSTLLPMIKKAQKEIWVSMFLFKTTTSPKNLVSSIINELIRAQKRGVSVHVLLEDSGYENSINKANTHVASRLRHDGVDVRFDTKKRTNHTKVVVIDQRYVFTGSHNFTHSALATNHEFSVMIDSPALAMKTLQYIKTIEVKP